ncbi:hypothetical protein GCM10009839_08130 [Catenulispora yoronensis]|uniref:Uncharacterized protein n=1 Tax=Catenulispora yoronensis TaxID=450799 RepID=A0ABP5F5G8_9ACTN
MGEADVDAGMAPDPARAADLGELIRELGRLRIWAGSPSYRTLAKSVGLCLRPPRAVSFRTVADVFVASRRRLDLDLLVAVVRALGLSETEVARWRDACVRVHADAKGADARSADARTAESGRSFRQLPADLATFTGRASELAGLLDVVAPSAASASTVVISAIDGMAGIGKSALQPMCECIYLRRCQSCLWSRA